MSVDPVLSFSPSARLSYAEMMASARELARVMQQLCLPERFVMLFQDPRANLITTYAALLSQRTGIQHAPVATPEAGSRLEALMQQAGIEAVLTAPECLSALNMHAPELCRPGRFFAVDPLLLACH